MLLVFKVVVMKLKIHVYVFKKIRKIFYKTYKHILKPCLPKIIFKSKLYRILIMHYRDYKTNQQIKSNLSKDYISYTRYKIVPYYLDPFSQEISEITNFSIAVHLHLYYEDLLDEFIAYLKNIEVGFDLFVTVVRESEIINEKLKKLFPNINILIVPNKGKDIGGFLEALREYNLDEYDLVLKIHTKKSLHNDKYFELIRNNLGIYIEDGEYWRRELLDSIVGSPEVVNDIVSIFRNKSDVGLIGNEKYLSFDRDVNEDLFSKLCDDLCVENRSIFIAGTMFWIRGSVLKLLKNSRRDFDSIDSVESSLEHCYERIFGAIVYKSGMKIYTRNSGVEDELFEWIKIYQERLNDNILTNTRLRNSFSYRTGRMLTSPLWITLKFIKELRWRIKKNYNKIKKFKK